MQLHAWVHAVCIQTHAMTAISHYHALLLHMTQTKHCSYTDCTCKYYMLCYRSSDPLKAKGYADAAIHSVNVALAAHYPNCKYMN
jgi:hypothetical protein